MRKDIASQIIGAQMISASDGSAFTGAVTAYVTGNGGTQAVGSVGAGACTHEGNGFHTYAPAQAETNYDHVAFTFTGSGAIPATVQVYPTFPQTGDNFARLGAPAGASVSADVAAIKAETATILSDTNDIQTRIPAALVSGRIDASVGAMAANVLTATAINADAITAAKVAADVSAEIAAATWDEVLTGATHNIVNSAGRRLRTLQDVGNYIGGAVWLDTGSANTGSTFPEDGTFLNPVNTLARALTVAAAATQAIKRLYVMAGSSITLASGYTGWHIDGDGYTLALGGQAITGSIFTHFGIMTGTATGTVPIFDTGAIGTATLPPCIIIGCGFLTTMTCGSAGDYIIIDSHSQVAGGGTPTIDLGAAVGATNLIIRRWSGGLTLNNVQAGDVVAVDAISGGTITVNGTGGTVNIRGMVNVTDGSGGSVTIVQSNVMDTRFDALDSAIDALPTNAELATALDVIPTAAENATAVGALTIAELAADPGATPAMKDALMLLYMAIRNKRDTTSSTDEIHNNAGTAVLAAAVSDDGVTFSKAKYA